MVEVSSLQLNAALTMCRGHKVMNYGNETACTDTYLTVTAQCFTLNRIFHVQIKK